jgi:vitamin B12 transporter
MRPLFLATAAPLALIFAQAHAQEAALDAGPLGGGVVALDEIVIDGALTALSPQPLARTGATVDVLEGAALEAGPTRDLGGALARLPGVSVSSNGGPGTSATLRLRGLDGAYVGVRIDGLDVTDPSSVQTGFDFGGLTRAGLGRVDVIKGSQSALYGSEAIAGVIDITTARSETLGFSGRAQAEAGSFDTRSGTLGVTQRGERGQLSFNVDRTVSDGISARAGDDEADGFEQTFATLTGEVAATEALTLGASGLWRDAEVEIDRSAADNTGENLTEQRGGRVFARLAALGAEHELSYGRFTTTREDPGGFTREFRGERRQLAYVGSAEIGATTLSLGVDRTEEESRTDGAGQKDATTSLLGEAVIRPTATLDVALSARHDDSDDFGGATTARLALAWQAAPETTLRAVAGTGFRAPSLFERFSAFGDPGLDPEESVSFELGLERRIGAGGFVKATAFRTEIDDLIRFDPASTACASGFGCYAQVEGRTRTRGIELSGRYALAEGRAALFGTYTYTDAEGADGRLSRVPRHDLTVGLEGAMTDRLSGRVELQHVADVEPSAFAPPDNQVGDHTLLGLGMGYEIREGVAVTLRVENLLDEQYETAGGFNQPGRAAYVGIAASF